MRLVVDAMCAEFGGNRTYVDHLLRRWCDVRPDDELHVVVPKCSTLSTYGHERHELAVTRPAVLFRPLAQTRELRRLVRSLDPTAVLATAPPTTLRRVGVPLAVVVLDLRHEIRPDQFSFGRRLIRKVAYGRTFRIADAFVTISARTLDDLHRRHPMTEQVPGTVAHLGGDHVLDWPAPTRSGPAVAFGHHTNKNPDLVLRAWSVAIERGNRVPDLIVVGASAASRERLGQIIDAASLLDRVTLAPYLDEPAFKNVLASAEMIVFPSTFEGFGLPIVEGMSMGKPVVIGPDPGSAEVAGGHASVMEEWTPESLADAVMAAMSKDDEELRKAAGWASTFRWETTVQTTATLIEHLVAH